MPGALLISHTSLLVLIQLINLRLEKECPSLVLLFSQLFEKYFGVVFWIAGGLSWSTWISIITLREGGHLLVFHDERFSAGWRKIYAVLYKGLLLNSCKLAFLFVFPASW